ncbi:LCP family protein [Kineococcus glutinatus]|uniref:Cell envelope-related transcriptional attenuator domain-containing protein n=1 Tax=Kineococcus glutinatus TaxID=1070872 RepID=A0ABP9I7C7_9ACTN
MPADPPYRDDQPTRRIPRTPPGRPTAPRRAEVPPAATQRLPRYDTGHDTRYGTSSHATPRDTRYAAPGAPRPTPRPPATPPRPAARPATARRRRRRWPVVLLLVALLVVGYPLLLGATAWTNVQQVEALPAEGSPADTPGTTFLVIGSDSREGLDAEQRAELSTGDDVGQRTDTIMLLHVPASGAPALISIPRDSYVPVPGHDSNKINAAFAFGGPTLLVQTVEQATGLHVDHYVETGFGGFAGVVDAVGGVEMCVPAPVQDERAGLDIAAGCQTMDGATALGFARYRYSDPLGDLGRVQRQRELIAAIAKAAATPSTLLNPARAVPLASAGGSALVLDEGASPLALLTFARGLQGAAGTDGISMTVPVSDPDLRTSSGIAVEWDEERAAQLFSALRADDTEALRALAG